MEVLEKIEMLRKEKGWSINYLAMESGLTQSTLNNLYSRNTEPKISTLRAICGAFGITLSEFFKEEEVKIGKIFRKEKVSGRFFQKSALPDLKADMLSSERSIRLSGNSTQWRSSAPPAAVFCGCGGWTSAICPRGYTVLNCSSIYPE